MSVSGSIPGIQTWEVTVRQATPQDRRHVRKAQRSATHRDAPRPLRTYIAICIAAPVTSRSINESWPFGHFQPITLNLP